MIKIRVKGKENIEDHSGRHLFIIGQLGNEEEGLTCKRPDEAGGKALGDAVSVWGSWIRFKIERLSPVSRL